MMKSHPPSLLTYTAVWIALLVLLALTFGASLMNLGPWNTPIAFSIAIVKGLLVVLFFMHVAHSGKLIFAVVITAFLWLGILFTLTLNDYLTRRNFIPAPMAVEREAPNRSILPGNALQRMPE
jgi:cytochrome c oxidase subunit IV